MDTRTWGGRRQRELHAWDSIIERMADAYVQWKFVSSANPSVSDDRYPYSLTVLDIFTMEKQLTIYQPPGDNPVPVNLALHGFLAKTPSLPNIAIGFRTLELFHRIRLRKASMSVEAFTRVICDYYEVCCQKLLSQIDIYHYLLLGSFPKILPDYSRGNV